MEKFHAPLPPPRTISRILESRIRVALNHQGAPTAIFAKCHDSMPSDTQHLDNETTAPIDRQTDSHPSISNDARSILKLSIFAPSISLSLSLEKFDRDILIACAKKNTKGEVSRRKELEAILESPGSGAHQRKPNFLPSFIDANILFDSDLLETRHVRRVETTFGHGGASGLERGTIPSFPSPPPTGNRISNSRREIS